MMRKQSCLKLTRVVMILTLLTCSASAWSNGFYLGIGAGPKAIDFNRNSTISSPGSYYTNDNSHLSGTGIFGSIFGGYGWIHHQYYLAGEVNFDVSNAKHQASNDELLNKNLNSTYYRLRNTFGLSVLPGYLFTPVTLFYARLGYARTFFNVSTTENNNANINRNLAGIYYGVGIRQTLSEKIDMRMEYSRVNYQDTTSNFYDPVGTTTKNTNIAPIASQVEFALIYNFK